jgi:hypothetical protein
VNARARRIRRQHRNHGKPCGPNSGILIRYFYPMWVNSKVGPRMRRIDYKYEDNRERFFSSCVGDWVVQP